MTPRLGIWCSILLSYEDMPAPLERALQKGQQMFGIAWRGLHFAASRRTGGGALFQSDEETAERDEKHARPTDGQQALTRNNAPKTATSTTLSLSTGATWDALPSFSARK